MNHRVVQFPKANSQRKQRGVSMIEVLITLVISAFGLLALAGLMTKTSAMTVEASQRARAMVMLQDMSDRVTNRRGADWSVYNDSYGLGDIQDCSALAGANQDVCEWGNLLSGSNETLTANAQQALTHVGCIVQDNTLGTVVIVSVAWSSNMQGVAPAAGCGSGLLGDDSYRKVIQSRIRIPDLAGG